MDQSWFSICKCSLLHKETSKESLQIWSSPSQAKAAVLLSLIKNCSQNRKNTFWFDIKRLNSSGTPPSAPVVDGVCGDTSIANLFAANFSDMLNITLL